LLVHPAIAESFSTAIAADTSGVEADSGLSATAVEGPDLLERFAVVSDGRSDQGRDHPVAVVLTLCAAAVLAGMRSFTAIAGWVADVPTELLVRLYGASDPRFPSKTTLWRVLTGVDTAAIDAVVGAWLGAQASAARHTTNLPDGPGGSELRAVAVDGKTVRGAVDVAGNQTHLLAVATHSEQLVLGQVEVGAKTNEIPMFAPLLDSLAATGTDLSGLVVTADALHCQRSHAEYLHQRGAGFVFTVKQNQPTLYAALDALPWAEVPIGHREVDHGHGRTTTRTIQVRPAPADLTFPHVKQVWLVERYVHNHDGTPISAVAALGVSALDADRAGPVELASLVRNHWGIESLHWLRDTVYREDHSTARTGSGPHAMTALRNLAIGALHLLGRRDITEATRWVTRVMDRPFKILGLIP
jgi:predicted transposase YbfD/YdcC